MALNVCVCEENLEVLEGGRLCVKTDCSLVNGASGLELAQISYYDNDSAVDAGPYVVDVTGVQIGPTLLCELTNPSTCRSMRVHVIEDDFVEFSMSADDVVRLQHRRIVNGGAPATSSVWLHGGLADAHTDGNRHNIDYFMVVAPGGTLSVAYNLVGTLISGAGGSSGANLAMNLIFHGVLI